MTTPTITEQYNVGPVKPYVLNAANLLGPMFGIKTIYGWRKTDPFPDHPSGHALDFMTPNSAVGDALSEYLIANASNLGVKYFIWNRRSWSPQGGWKPYTATTNPHTDHVHVTFTDQAAPWTTTAGFTPTGTGTLAAAVDDTCAWQINFPSFAGIGGGDVCLLSKPHARALMGGILLGAGASVAIIGVILLMVYGLGQTKAGTLLPAGVRRFI